MKEIPYSTSKNDAPLDEHFQVPWFDPSAPAPSSQPLQAQETEQETEPSLYTPEESSVPEPREEIDPGFSVFPPTTPPRPSIPAIPTFPSRPTYPSQPVLPSYPVYPSFPPVQKPIFPCLTCENNQWMEGAIRLLHAAAGYNPLQVLIDGVMASSALEFAQLTQYKRISQGYHTFTVTDRGQNTGFSKKLYIGDGMATIAFTNGPNGLDILSISDPSCPTSGYNGCLRVCNLAYYSGNVNVALDHLIFNSVAFGRTSSFNRLNAGSYNLRVARSVRPEITLLSSSLYITANRIHTLYVLNWNQSPDAIQTLLTTDKRG